MSLSSSLSFVITIKHGIWYTINMNNYFLLEVYIFLRAIGQSVSSLALNLLIQDKICFNKYNQSSYFCQHINNINDDSIMVEQSIKNHILAESTQFGNYKYLDYLYYLYLNICLSSLQEIFLNASPWFCGHCLLVHFWIAILVMAPKLFYFLECLVIYLQWSFILLIAIFFMVQVFICLLFEYI